MKLLDIERLVNKIANGMKDPASSAVLPALAQQYADASRLTNARLEQCWTMIKNGEERQALQAAEAPPALLDVVKTLGFAAASDWRDRCVQEDYAVPADLDRQAIHALNDLYSKGINANDPLYREYKGYMLRNRETEAMAVLKSIVRLNPTDETARGELQRLEAKLLDLKLREAAAAAAKGEVNRVLTLLDEVESGCFSTRPSGPQYEAAVKVRRRHATDQAMACCQTHFAGLQTAMTRNDWQPARALLGQIKDLCAEHDLRLSDEQKRSIAQMEEWLKPRIEAHQRRRDYELALQEVQGLVQTQENRRATRAGLTVRDSRAALAALVAAWRRVEEFQQPVPPDLGSQFKKQMQLLGDEVRQMEKRRKLLIAAAIFAVAALTALAGYVVQRRSEAQTLVAQMNRLKNARDVDGAQSFLSRERACMQALEWGGANLAATRRSLEEFLAREDSLWREFNRQFQELEVCHRKGLTAERVEEVSAQHQKTLVAREALAPVCGLQAEAQLSPIKEAWEQFLQAYSKNHNDEFRALLRQADPLVKEAGDIHRKPTDRCRSLDEITKVIGRLDALDAVKIPESEISRSLHIQYSTLTNHHARLSANLKKISDICQQLNDSGSVEDYLKTLAALRDAGGLSAELSDAVRDILERRPSADDLALAIVFHGDSAALSFWKENPGAGLVPTTTALKPEKLLYDEVCTDPNIINLYRHQFRDQFGEDMRTVYVRGDLVELRKPGYISGKVVDQKSFGVYEGELYDPMRHDKGLHFESRKSSGEFQPVKSLTPDSQAFSRLGFQSLLDLNTGKFSRGASDAPLHEFLDRLKASAEASPIFKAYLMGRAYDLMKAGDRSMAWGLQYTPSLGQHIKELLAIEAPQSGDWLVPAAIRAKEPKLKKFFELTAKISYRKQAAALHAVAQATRKAGFSFAGYLDDNGHVVCFRKIPKGWPVWGWMRPPLGWRVVCRGTESGAALDAGETPLPFTPLFSFGADAAVILSDAYKEHDVSASEANLYIKPFLPPLFPQ